MHDTRVARVGLVPWHLWRTPPTFERRGYAPDRGVFRGSAGLVRGAWTIACGVGWLRAGSPDAYVVDGVQAVVWAGKDG